MFNYDINGISNEVLRELCKIMLKIQKVELKVDGHIMGQEFHMEETLPIEIEGKVMGEEKIGKVELIKNNQVIYSVMGNSDQVQLNYIDEDISERNNYYYLRASQTDGRMVWSTPVWVTCRDQPDLSVHIRYLSREFPETKIGSIKGLPDSKEKLTIWSKKKNSKTKIQIRWKGENAGETCSGELHLKNIQNYLVHMSGFHDQYDLFTDDGSGLVLWNVKLGKEVKGLNMITAAKREKRGSAEIRVIIDEKRMFKNVLMNGKRVSPKNNWIVKRL